MKIILTVTTCPKRKVDYLSSTVEQLDEYGALQCDERMPEKTYHGWLIRPNYQQTGHKLTLWRAFMLAKERQADWLISCEDDLTLTPYAISRIINDTDISSWPKRRGMITYFDCHLDNGIEFAGIKEMKHGPPERVFTGALCMLFRREVIEYLADFNPLTKFDTQDTLNFGDYYLGHVLSRSRWNDYGIRIPTLVDHAGLVSSICIPPPANHVRGRNLLR